MTEAMRDPFRSSRAPMAGLPQQAVNGAALRWTPGPDERRLPSSESEEEHVPQNTAQGVAIEEGAGALRLHWRGRRDVFVGSDQFLYWDPAYDPRKNPENPPAAPDVYVAFDVANRHRNSYVAWEEGKPPDFVLEIVSPSSRRRDVKEKPGVYAKIGVPEFFLYDPGDDDEQPLPHVPPALVGFELRGGRGGEYRPLLKEELPSGVVGIRSKVLGLCLCVQRTGLEPLDGSLRWYDPAAGGFLPTRHELAENKRRLVDDNHRLVDDNHRLADDKRRLVDDNHRLADDKRRLADDKRRLADDKRRLADDKRQAEARAEASAARVAELEALVEKMRRG